MALVTGSGKRVGRAIALTLAQAGYDLAIHYNQSHDGASQVADQIIHTGRKAITIGADLGGDQGPQKIFNAVKTHFGRLDALINNASVFSPQSLGQITHQDLMTQYQINAVAPLMLMQLFTPMLSEHHHAQDVTSTGRIVNFIDIHVMGEPLQGYLPYNMSKAALQEITHTAAMELAPKITVNAIAPGVIDWAEIYTPHMKEAYLERVPLARAGTPQDAADAVRFLVCEAHYCTGQTIKIDGGRLLT